MNESEENFLNAFSFEKTIVETSKIQQLNYSPTGEYFSYTVDDSLKIHDAKNRSLKNIITVKMDTMAYFTRNTLLHSKENMIYYLSIYDNTYLRTFTDHKDKILSISVNDISDTFMSCGKETIKLWDIRYKDPIASFNSNGKLGALSRETDFAIADNNFIYIYDFRKPEHPKETKQIKPAFYKKMWYSHDSSCICLSNFTSNLFLHDNGDYLTNFNLENECDGCCINESNIFLSGSAENLMAYKIQDKKRIGRIFLPEFEISYARANPTISQFIVGNENSLKVFNRTSGR